MNAVPGARRGFAPRPVSGAEAPELLRRTLALLAAAPLRLAGLFLLVFLPLQFLPNLPYLALPLRAALASVGFCGFFVVLESVRQGRKAQPGELLAPWRLPAAKIGLLVAVGVLPLAAVLAVWALDLGGHATNDLIAGRTPSEAVGLREQLEFVAAYNLAGMPFFFTQPLAVLHRWEAGRTLAAGLIAWAVNWRWVLAISLALVPLSIASSATASDNALEQALALAIDVGVEMLLCALTLCLLQRSLED